MPIRFVFFDVGDTLLHKPALFERIGGVLGRHGYSVSAAHLRQVHKLVRELIVFPDRTSRSFYMQFNARLLESLGISPTGALAEEIFDSCDRLPWAVFDDVSVLAELAVPLGVCSNWSSALPDVLKKHVPHSFEAIVVSEQVGCAKPDSTFFEHALERAGYPPGEVMMVGDSIRLDVTTPLQLGMHPVLLDRYDVYPTRSGHRVGTLAQLPELLSELS